MNTNELDRIRQRLGTTSYSPWKDDTFALLAEVERLRADRDRLAATVDRVRALADGWASTGEPATKERQAALHGAARRLRAAIEGTDS